MGIFLAKTPLPACPPEGPHPQYGVRSPTEQSIWLPWVLRELLRGSQLWLKPGPHLAASPPPPGKSPGLPCGSPVSALRMGPALRDPHAGRPASCASRTCLLVLAVRSSPASVHSQVVTCRCSPSAGCHLPVLMFNRSSFSVPNVHLSVGESASGAHAPNQKQPQAWDRPLLSLGWPGGTSQKRTLADPGSKVLPGISQGSSGGLFAHKAGKT